MKAIRSLGGLVALGVCLGACSGSGSSSSSTSGTAGSNGAAAGSASSSSSTSAAAGSNGSNAAAGSAGASNGANAGSTGGTPGSTNGTSTAGAGSTGGSTSAAFTTFCNTVVSDLSSLEAMCSNSSAVYYGAALTSEGFCSGLAAGITAGNVTFNSGSAQGCLNDLGALSCNSVVGSNLPASCQATIMGTVGAGGNCYSGGSDCQAGFACTMNNNACPGTCVAEVAAGQSCSGSDVCVNGYSCQGGTCQANPASPTLGQACQPNEGNCVFSACLGGRDGGICTAYVAQGQACTGTGVSCGQGLYCDLTTNTCAAVPTMGSPCGLVAGGMSQNTFAYCTPPAYCTAGTADGGGYVGVCAPYLAAGAACSSADIDNQQCGLEATCINGVCTSTNCAEP